LHLSPFNHYLGFVKGREQIICTAFVTTTILAILLYSFYIENFIFGMVLCLFYVVFIAFCIKAPEICLSTLAQKVKTCIDISRIYREHIFGEQLRTQKRYLLSTFFIRGFKLIIFSFLLMSTATLFG
jgi:hypothetical protein